MSNVFLRATDVSFSYVLNYPDIKTHLVRRRSQEVSLSLFNHLDLDLNNGDRLCILGRNGAGKTSLLRLLSGIIPPDKGCIRSNGKIGTILGDAIGFEMEMSGLDNVISRILMTNTPKHKRTDKIREIIEFSELGNAIHRPMKTYSSGMNLRLGFAILTSDTPDILIMDEIISAGDQNFMKKANERIEELIDGSGILVLATHDYASAIKYCNKSLLIENGNIIEYATVEEGWKAYLGR